MSVDIRPFDGLQRNAIGALISRIQRDEFHIPISLADQPDLADIAAFYQLPGGNFWVARSNTRVVGTIALLNIGNRQGALRKMFVDADFRGKNSGVSKRLLDELLSWSRAEGFREIFLGTTAAFHAAHRFYEKNGFERVDPEALPQTFPIMKVDTLFYRIAI